VIVGAVDEVVVEVTVQEAFELVDFGCFGAFTQEREPSWE
jgi:hypothetical protein